MTWEIEGLVRCAQPNEPDPGSDLPGKLFVPSTVRTPALGAHIWLRLSPWRGSYGFPIETLLFVALIRQ